MQYELIVQLRAGSLGATEMIALEQELVEAMGDRATVDGHDVGAKQVNFFLNTADPASAFRRAKPVLERRGLLERVTVAHRLVAGLRFTILWPLRPLRKFSLD